MCLGWSPHTSQMTAQVIRSHFPTLIANKSTYHCYLHRPNTLFLASPTVRHGSVVYCVSNNMFNITMAATNDFHYQLCFDLNSANCFKQAMVISSNVLFCVTNSPKSRDFQLTFVQETISREDIDNYTSFYRVQQPWDLITENIVIQ